MAGKVGFSKAMSAGWIVLDKTPGSAPTVNRKVDTIADTIKVIFLYSTMEQKTNFLYFDDSSKCYHLTNSYCFCIAEALQDEPSFRIFVSL